MAIGIYFAPTTMTQQQYFECIKRLKKAGAGHPPGRALPRCFGTGDRIQVFDVWTSQAAFDKFGRTLMPILQDIGTDSGPAGRHEHAQRHHPAGGTAAGRGRQARAGQAGGAKKTPRSVFGSA